MSQNLVFLSHAVKDDFFVKNLSMAEKSEFPTGIHKLLRFPGNQRLSQLPLGQRQLGQPSVAPNPPFKVVWASHRSDFRRFCLKTMANGLFCLSAETQIEFEDEISFEIVFRAMFMHFLDLSHHLAICPSHQSIPPLFWVRPAYSLLSAHLFVECNGIFPGDILFCLNEICSKK